MRRKALALAAAFAATLTVGGAATATNTTRAAAPPDRPNIVVLMTDDQTLESLRVMSKTRALIGARGTTFTNAFVSFSLCCPSRATFLTGQYAHNHGVMGNTPPDGGYAKLDGTKTLPVWLQRAGYSTTHVGKYLNGYGTKVPTEIPPGWSEWHASVDPSTYRFYEYTLNENGGLVNYGKDAASYSTDVYSRIAGDVIRRRAPEAAPFFLSVAFLAPHAGGPSTADDPKGVGIATPDPAPRHRNLFKSEQLPAPPSFNEADMADKPASMRGRKSLTNKQIAGIRENYRQRLESLLAVDEAVESITTTLSQTGELERTLIVFTSDNGYFHGEHRVPQGKILPYEPSIRVPLLMAGPSVPVGRNVDQHVANIDLAPTLVAAARAIPDRVMDGRSLWPLLSDDNIEWGRDILIERGPGSAAARFSAIRSQAWLYAEYGNGDRELYDLRNDPYQVSSLHASAAHAPLIAALGERLKRLQTCAGPSCYLAPRVRFAVTYGGPIGPRSACLARGLVVGRVRGLDTSRITRVDLYLNGRLVDREMSAPFGLALKRKRVGTTGDLRARIVFSDDRVYTIDRDVRGCKK